MDNLYHAHVDGPAEKILELAEKLRKAGLDTTVDRVHDHCAGPQSQKPSHAETYAVHNPRVFAAFTTTSIEGQHDLEILMGLVRTIHGVVLEVEQVIGASTGDQGLVWYPQDQLEFPGRGIPPSEKDSIEVHVRFEAKNPSSISPQEIMERATQAGVDIGGLFVLDTGGPKRVFWSNAFYDEEHIRERVEDQRRRLGEAFRDFTVTMLVERVLEIVRS